jgi:hypothetical protein
MEPAWWGSSRLFAAGLNRGGLIMAWSYAYRIPMTKLDHIEEGVRRTPSYETQVARAISRTIQVMHGLPDLHDLSELRDFEVYLGRAASPELVLDRWQSHWKSRGHSYAALLFRCDPTRVVKLETIAIKILQSLKANKALCVGNANVLPHGGGANVKRGESLVYITWQTSMQKLNFGKPGVALIREIADTVAGEVDDGPTPRQLETGLLAVKRLKEKAALQWYPDYPNW